MENIVIRTAEVQLSFLILEDGRIRLAQYGCPNHLVDCGSCLPLSRFIEVGAAGFDHLGHHGVKGSGSYFGEHALYVSHEIKELDGKKELIIVTSDLFFGVSTHFILYPGSASYSVYSDVKNISSSLQTLEYVSSLYLYGFDEGISANDLRLSFATNGWHQEAQWNSFSFQELGIFADKGATGPKRWHLGNVGSWPSKEYLPMIAVSKIKETILAEVESNVSWNIEVAGEGERRYLLLAGPTATDSSWLKDLNPGETFRSVSATISLGEDFEGALAALTKARRLMRMKKKDDEELPVIFNSYMHALWDLQTEETLKPLIESAAKAGSEVFCIDAGWFAPKSDWWASIGDWKEEAANFPNGGLHKTLDYIRSLGMEAGLWIEIENVGEGSLLWKNAPKDFFLSIKGHPVFEHERHCLDFSNPCVSQWALTTIDRLMNLYHLDYLKCDYNVDAGVGSDREASSLGDGLLKNGRAILAFYDEVQRRYPDLTIENCASGGARMDYETLKHFPIQSTSDQTDFRLYPYIAGNVLTACPPDQAAVWSYPVDSTRKIDEITDEDVVLNMVNAMLGQIHLASFLDRLSHKQQDLVAEGVEAYKATRQIKKDAHPVFPRGLARWNDPDVVAGIANGDTMILAVWNTSGKPSEIKVNLRKYGLKDLKVLYPTSLGTSFYFDPADGILTLKAPAPYFGRAFIGKL